MDNDKASLYFIRPYKRLFMCRVICCCRWYVICNYKVIGNEENRKDGTGPATTSQAPVEIDGALPAGGFHQRQEVHGQYDQRQPGRHAD